MTIIEKGWERKGIYKYTHTKVKEALASREPFIPKGDYQGDIKHLE